MKRWCAVLAGLLALVGCGGDDGGSDGPVRLTVQVAGEPEETAAYDLVARAFEQGNPDVDIELVEVADRDDHLVKLATSFSAGDPPEVFLVNFREYAPFVARDAIEPVGPLLEEAGVDLGAYYEEATEAFTFDGALQCMPQNVSSLVVYYNTALFAAAGLAAPEAGWDWDDFRGVARALTAGDVRGLGIEPRVIRIAPFVWSNGGEVVDDLLAPTRFTLDEPRAREALEYLVGLVRDDGVVPTEAELAAQDLETRFVTDKLGMFLSSRRDVPVFREVAGLEWDVAPLPVAPGGEPASVLHSDGYCISAGTGEVDAAARFVRFATGPEGQTVTALAGRTVPSLRSVASSIFLDPTRPPSRSQVFLDGIPVLHRTPVTATWPEIEDVAGEVLTRAFYEPGYSLDEALADLEEQTAELFADAAPG